MVNSNVQDFDSDLRNQQRIEVAIPVSFRGRAATKRSTVVVDISTHGFRVSWPTSFEPGEQVWLTPPGMEAMLARVVRYDDFELGCELLSPLHPAVFDHLKSRWQLSPDGTSRL